MQPLYACSSFIFLEECNLAFLKHASHDWENESTVSNQRLQHDWIPDAEPILTFVVLGVDISSQESCCPLGKAPGALASIGPEFHTELAYY